MDTRISQWYNSSRKIAYIEDKLGLSYGDGVWNDNEPDLRDKRPMRLYLERWFLKTLEFEQKFSKDLCEFEDVQITKMYEKWKLSSYDAILNLNAQLSLYCEWCVEKKFSKENHFKELKRDKLMQCIDTKALQDQVIDEEQMDSWLDQMVNPGDKFIFCCLWEGIGGKQYTEIRNMKVEDIDQEKKEVFLPNRNASVPVSARLIEYALSSDQQLKYYPPLDPDCTRRLEYAPSDKIVKDFSTIDDMHGDAARSEIEGGRRIYRKIVRNLQSFAPDSHLRPNSIAESGKIAFIRDLCKKEKISAKEFLFSPRIEQVNKQFDCKICRSVFYDKYKEALTKLY